MITANNTPHLPGWLDLGSPDPAASAEFYRKVFGWSSEEASSEAQASEQAQQQPEMTYFMLSKGGQIVAGLGGLQDPKAQPEWTVYIREPDIELKAKSCESLGGSVRVEPMQIGPEGAFAQLTDSTGAEFALWQPGKFTGFARCCEEDSLLWVELYTHDAAASKRFYGEMFDWKTEPFTMSEGTYDMWTTNPGSSTDSFGGMMAIAGNLPIQKDMWVPYFQVADTDETVARAVAAGGKVLMPAEDAPPGRLAALTDQFGAHFNLLKPAPMG